MGSKAVLSWAGVLTLALSAMAQEATTPPMSPTPPKADAEALNLLRQLDRGFVAIFNQVAPTVVVVENTRQPSEQASESNEMFDFFFHSPDDDSRRRFKMPGADSSSEGSGFILRQDGYILTNHHVIDGAEKLMVRLKDGRQFQAKVIGTDERSDVAVIKIEATGLPTAVLGDSDALQVGQVVGAIGIPFALDYSFSVGVVSGKGRANISTSAMYQDYIQTDSFINPGSSGGPLFDVEGKVIGMNTLINGIGRGLAFAIPSNMLKEISGELIATGKVRRPWLGIRIETLEPESSLREQLSGVEKGVVVNTIEPDAPAYKSDLRPLDVITAVDGTPVETAHALQKLVLRKKVGEALNLKVWRSGKTLDITVTTGELPAVDTTASTEGKETPDASPGGTAVFKDYGLELADGKSGPGVVVTKVTPGSAAEIADIQVNDVITEVNNQPVKNVTQAVEQLSRSGADRNKPVLLFLERKGQKTYAVLKIERD